MKTLKFFGMSVLTALFAAIVLVACTNENVTDEKPITKSNETAWPDNAPFSFRNLGELTEEEAEEYGTMCAELHNEALEYAYNAFSNMDTYTLYEMLHDSATMYTVTIEIVEQFVAEYVNDIEHEDIFSSTEELLTYTESDEYKEYRETLIEDNAGRLNDFYDLDPDKYSVHFGDLASLYASMESYYCTIGTYIPMLPAFCGLKMSEYSTSYWNTEYDKWFELFYYADEEHHDDGEGDDGDGGDGDKKDPWRDNLRDVAMSDVHGAIAGAVGSVVSIGVKAIIGLTTPVGTAAVVGSIVADALKSAVISSTITVIGQIKDDMTEVRAYGEYIHYNP